MLIEKRLHRLLDFPVVHQPAGYGIHFALYGNRYAIAVAVQPAALMEGWFRF